MQLLNSLLISLAALTGILFAGLVWTGVRTRLQYDLWRISGSRPWPLIGNLGSFLGSSHFHKVRAVIGSVMVCGTLYLWYSQKLVQSAHTHRPHPVHQLP